MTTKRDLRIFAGMPDSVSFEDIAKAAALCCSGRFPSVRHWELGGVVSTRFAGLDSVPCATVRFSEPAAFSGSLIRLRVDQSRVVPDYLRLYLSSRQGSAALSAAATGSVISNLRRAALQEVEIHLLDLQTQRIVVASTTRIEEQLLHLQTVEELLRDLYDTAREGLAAGILETRGIARAGDPE